MVTRNGVLDALKEVEDPELMMSIVDLGLVYRADVTEEKVEVDFTLTYPGCPVGESIQQDIRRVLEDIAEGRTVVVNLVWNPPWAPDFMSDEAKVSLGYPV